MTLVELTSKHLYFYFRVTAKFEVFPGWNPNCGRDVIIWIIQIMNL